ncbi:MAG: hypothetical protein ACOYON_16480 [Fimbriimonas sp.]
MLPTWWLVLSGAFFVLNIVYLGVLTFILLQVQKQMAETKPKIDALAVRVESIATNVDDMTKTLNQTVKTVGARAQSISGGVELASAALGNQVTRLAPVISTVMTVLKFVQAYREFRQPKQAPKKK